MAKGPGVQKQRKKRSSSQHAPPVTAALATLAAADLADPSTSRIPVSIFVFFRRCTVGGGEEGGRG